MYILIITTAVLHSS